MTAAGDALALRTRLREVARRAWEAALRRVEPASAVRAALAIDGDRLVAGSHVVPLPSRVVVLGLGKAGVPMLRGALDVLASRDVGGLVVVKDGHAEGLTSLGGVRIAEAAHPVPDARGERLAREMLRLAASCDEATLGLVLVSGGGSALLACPADGLTLDDLGATTRVLLRSGADIHELNAVRKHLSALTGGRLAQALGGSRSLSLLVSDVIGDEPSSIASGPTVPDPTTFADALAVLDRRVPAKDLPARVRAHLEAGRDGRVPETAGPRDVDWSRHPHVIVASNADAVAAAAESLRREGFAVAQLRSPIRGDVADVATDHASRLRSCRDAPSAVVAGGEPTVVVSGEGLGGRNQHLAALLARHLDTAREPPDGAATRCEVAFAAIGTDGTDGPTEAAGGLVDAGSWARARGAGVDPEALLARFDSHALLAASGDLVVTGPTGTNVMDVHVALSHPTS